MKKEALKMWIRSSIICYERTFDTMNWGKEKLSLVLPLDFGPTPYILGL